MLKFNFFRWKLNLIQALCIRPGKETHLCWLGSFFPFTEQSSLFMLPENDVRALFSVLVFFPAPVIKIPWQRELEREESALPEILGDSLSMATLIDGNILLGWLILQRFSSLSWQGAWQYTDRHGAGEAAVSSTSGSTGSRKWLQVIRPGLSYKDHLLGIHFFQQGHTSSNKATPPDSAFLLTYMYGGLFYSKPTLAFLWQDL